MEKTKFDLAIVGAGVLGAFHAYHAIQKGLSVALIEKDLAPAGASTQNFGQVVPSGMNIKWQNYGKKSLEIYKEIQSQFDISVRQNGSIYLASNEEELCLIQELHEINKLNNYPSILLSKEACYNKYPQLNKDYCVGGLFFEQEVSVNPRILIHRVLEFLVTKKNLVLLKNNLVQEIDTKSTDNALVIFSNKQFIEAKKVIVCSGTDFQNLYPEEFSQSDLELVKLQMLKLAPQPTCKIAGNILTGLSIRRYESFQNCPSYKTIKEKEDSTSFWKKWGVHILFKQEEDGTIILGDSHEYATIGSRDKLKNIIYNDVNQYFIEEGQKIFNLDHWHVADEWLGYYSQCTEQDVFQQTIDDKVHIVTGIGGKGMTASAGFAFEHINKLYK